MKITDYLILDKSEFGNNDKLVKFHTLLYHAQGFNQETDNLIMKLVTASFYYRQTEEFTHLVQFRDHQISFVNVYNNNRVMRTYLEGILE